MVAARIPPTPEEEGWADCVLSLDNIRVLRKAYFVERICQLRPGRMDDVCRALASATGCSY